MGRGGGGGGTVMVIANLVRFNNAANVLRGKGSE